MKISKRDVRLWLFHFANITVQVFNICRQFGIEFSLLRAASVFCAIVAAACIFRTIMNY